MFDIAKVANNTVGLLDGSTSCMTAVVGELVV